MLPIEPFKSVISEIQNNPRRRWPLATIAVAAFIFLAPNVDFAHALEWHDGQRLAQLTLLAIMLLTLLIPGAATAAAGMWTDLPLTIRGALTAAFILGLASSFNAQMPRWALLDWGLLLLLFVMATCVAANRKMLGNNADQWLVLLFFATASAYAVTTCSIYSVMLLLGPGYGQAFNVRELYTSFSNIRFFGQFQTMLLPFLFLPAMWWGKKRLSRVLLWSVPVIWWVLAVGSGTRGTWAALLAGVIATLLFSGDMGRRWAKWQCAGLMCGLIGYAIFIWGIPQFLDIPTSFLHRTNDLVSLSLREVLWSTALGYAVQHPLLGVGPMHYAYWATEVAAHPHNAILQWLAEWGMPATLLLTGVWVAGGISLAKRVRKAVSQSDEPSYLFRVALLAALTGAFAQAMVDGIFVMPVSQTLLALLCGWALGMFPAERRTAAVAASWVRPFLLTVVLFAAAAVVYGVTPEIGRLAERQEAYLKSRVPEPPLLPRFWALGWINQ